MRCHLDSGQAAGGTGIRSSLHCLGEPSLLLNFKVPQNTVAAYLSSDLLLASHQCIACSWHFLFISLCFCECACMGGVWTHVGTCPGLFNSDYICFLPKEQRWPNLFT